MADIEIKTIEGVQDTGNPVLDSFVNVVRTKAVGLDAKTLTALHSTLAELAQKEPGGLKCRMDCKKVSAKREEANP